LGDKPSTECRKQTIIPFKVGVQVVYKRRHCKQHESELRADTRGTISSANGSSTMSWVSAALERAVADIDISTSTVHLLSFHALVD